MGFVEPPRQAFGQEGGLIVATLPQARSCQGYGDEQIDPSLYVGAKQLREGPLQMERSMVLETVDRGGERSTVVMGRCDTNPGGSAEICEPASGKGFEGRTAAGAKANPLDENPAARAAVRQQQVQTVGNPISCSHGAFIAAGAKWLSLTVTQSRANAARYE